MLNKPEIRILVVCLGNICRSPALEVTLKKALADLNVTNVHVESRGLSAKQSGKPVDELVRAELVRRGYTVPETKVSILLSEKDFFDFDYILAVDGKVLSYVQAEKPPEANPIIELASHWSESEMKEIPDPYRGHEELTPLSIDLAEQYSKKIAEFLAKLSH